MKKVSLLAIALCTCATFFCERDTRTEREGGRDVEPRLSNVKQWTACRSKEPVPGHVVGETECGPATVVAHDDAMACEEINTTDQALRAVSSQPECIDAAIAALKRAAEGDARVISDLAAAYYVRAQRQDRPADLLESLKTADQAIARNPKLLPARFNRALAMEALGLREEAIAAWNDFVPIADDAWREEALQRRDRLAKRVTHPERWQQDLDALSAALRARDRNAVARLVEPHPSAAQRYFEEELLPQWAETPAAEQFAQVQLFAAELSSRLKGDRFPIDVVDAISRAAHSPKKLAALREGHRAIGRARRAEQSFTGNAMALYASAARSLAQGDSPFRLRADLGSGVGLDSLESEARARGYRHLLARIHWRRAFSLANESSYLEAAAAYEDARKSYAFLHDEEGLTAVHSRLAGIYRALGDQDRTWREAFYAQRHAHHLMEVKNQNAQLLEVAWSARDLGYHQSELLYLNVAVNELDRARKEALQADSQLRSTLETNLAVALRHRAGAELRLGFLDRAANDLDQAMSLTNSRDEMDSSVRIALRARNAEITAQKLLNGDPDGAVAEFTRALENTSSGLTTFHASLFAQRAEANLRADHLDAALDDLQKALDVLHQEEQAILAKRTRGKAEEFWRPYFERFQDTYRVLIRLRMDNGEPDLAFAYAERARAAEPLNLVGRGPATVREIQQTLPPQTFILEYCVLDDRTYLWLIGREVFQSFEARGVSREKIEDWSTRLQNAVRDGLIDDIGTVLRAAYDDLLTNPLAAIPGGVKGTRLVVIPDGAIHGLPIAALRGPQKHLIEDAAIEISGSAALYLHSLSRDRALVSLPTPPVLVIGDPDFDESLPFAQGMKRLPYSKAEANGIREVHPHAEILTDAGATVPAFLERAPQHEIVHVAAHGIVNAQSPEHSMLLLPPAGLDAQEILSRLKPGRTRLVVLSACSSAGGLPVGSEGVAPLVRPILAAGVPGVIGSLWDVQDNATTEELMVSFHRHYATGKDAAEAMRAAQLEMLHQNKSVVAWAGFQVIGHASSPFAARAPNPGGTQIGIHSSNSLQRSDRLRPE